MTDIRKKELSSLSLMLMYACFNSTVEQEGAVHLHIILPLSSVIAGVEIFFMVTQVLS